jgi:large subunit ribosomal protein L5
MSSVTRSRLNSAWRTSWRSPASTKIVVNVGVGAATEQKALIEKIVTDLTIITGQKPIITKAKKSIAGFKLREGNPSA